MVVGWGSLWEFWDKSRVIENESTPYPLIHANERESFLKPVVVIGICGRERNLRWCGGWIIDLFGALLPEWLEVRYMLTNVMITVLMKTLRDILCFLISSGVILGSVSFPAVSDFSHDSGSCCCSSEADLSIVVESCCSPSGNNDPCDLLKDSESCCSEHCQNCNTFFSKILLYHQEQPHCSLGQESFHFRFSREIGSSLTHSPDTPPPKALA